MQDYSRGSEWRKWDLHIHTASSYDYKNSEYTDELFLDKLVNEGISVVAITDHHKMDVQRIKKLQQLAKNAYDEKITVLPGIEFASDRRTKKRMHFIGIFAESSDLDFIWAKINAKTDLIDKRQVSKKEEELYCPLDDTCKLIHELGGIISIHSGNKSNSVDQMNWEDPLNKEEITDIYGRIDLSEFSKIKDVDYYKKQRINKIKEKYNKIVPAIICSDNHNFNKYHEKKYNLWIKGDTGFRGLLQAIKEPQDRIFIGDQPEIFERIRNDSTKFIKSLSIGKSDNFSLENEIWFENVNLPINPELVAIIGNKGNGKSAIADIMGLCGKADLLDKDFVFLNKDKFHKNKLSSNFKASIQWHNDSETEEINLNNKISNVTGAHRVKYISQGFFEKLCNEIDKSEDFRKEIEKVVFQHVPDFKKIGATTFEEFVKRQKKQYDDKRVILVNQLSEINDLIIECENKLSPEYRKIIESKWELQRKEKEAHNSIKPKELEPPNKEENEVFQTNLAELNMKKENLQKFIESQKKELNKISIEENELQNLKSDLLNKKEELKLYLSHISLKLEKYQINPIDIFEYNIDSTKIESLLNSKTEKINALEEEIKVSEKPDSLYKKCSEIELEIKDLISKTGKAEQEYQKYIQAKNKWETGLGEINSSIENSKKKIVDIETSQPPKLEQLKAERIKVTKLIYNEIQKTRKIFDILKESIDEKLIEIGSVEIASSLKISNSFEDQLLKFINQRRSGSFYGVDEGEKYLIETILKDKNMNEFKELENIINEILLSLEIDRRGNLSKTERENDISKYVSDRKEFYDFLFSLKYLDQFYDLKLRGKPLDLLSPGEKGSLLLIFYFLLEKSNIPLIIDQPEDNLDNQSVSEDLIPLIKEAKKNRQIIMVTHNPNLAVVADAEQIIYVKIDKDDQHKFSIQSGSIENEIINKKVVEVLEGTMPAFTNRRDKYHL
jgi:ABC-type lipoprotein export system ATPase subunit